MLEIKQIDKVYSPGTVHETCLFQGFSLQIEAGSFVSVVGSNGSGKTSLLNILCGTIPVDQGTITVDGQNLTHLKEYTRYRRMGRVYQNPAMGTCATMTILENLVLAGYTLSRFRPFVSPKHENEAWCAYQASLSIRAEHPGNPVGSLSGGNQQKVFLAR